MADGGPTDDAVENEPVVDPIVPDSIQKASADVAVTEVVDFVVAQEEILDGVATPFDGNEQHQPDSQVALRTPENVKLVDKEEQEEDDKYEYKEGQEVDKSFSEIKNVNGVAYVLTREKSNASRTTQYAMASAYNSEDEDAQDGFSVEDTDAPRPDILDEAITPVITGNRTVVEELNISQSFGFERASYTDFDFHKLLAQSGLDLDDDITDSDTVSSSTPSTTQSTTPSTPQSTPIFDGGAPKQTLEATAIGSPFNVSIAWRKDSLSADLYQRADTPEALHLLKERITEMCRTTTVSEVVNGHVFEGDLSKVLRISLITRKAVTALRRYILLKTKNEGAVLLWASYQSHKDSDNLNVKGRLDVGDFNIFDLPDGYQHGSQNLSNAFGINNCCKGQVTVVIAPSSETKARWLAKFRQVGARVESGGFDS